LAVAETIERSEQADPARGELKPPVPVKLFYGFGQAVESGYLFVSSLVFFYYTAVLGLSGSLVGLALAISMAVDAVFDPLIGSLSDNVRSKLGRRLPPMLIGAPLFAISLWLLFSPPAGLAPFVLFGWLTFFKLSIRGLASLFNLPYFALGAEMADGYVERSSIVAYRTIAGIIVGVALTILAYSVFFKGPGGLQSAERYPAFGLTVATLLLASALICCAGVWRYIVQLPQPMTPPRPLLRALAPEVAEIFRNRSFRTLFLSALVVYVASGLNAALNTYAYVFVWKLDSGMIQTITFAYLAGILIGVPLTPALLRRMEKRSAVVLGLAIIMTSWIVLPSLRASGVFVAAGAAALPWVAANVLWAGFGTGFLAIAYPSMMADAADEHEVLFGSRREGLYFAGLGFANKAAGGLGALLGGVALDFLKFPKEAGRQVGVDLPEALQSHLMIAWGPAAAVLGVIATVMLLPYAITRARHDDIAARLKVKRADDVAEGRSS
jgi:glycoside/pentoside/hexuronide:cation symporter, GPH family